MIFVGLFKSIVAELGVDPIILNLLVGHAIKGIDTLLAYGLGFAEGTLNLLHPDPHGHCRNRTIRPAGTKIPRRFDLPRGARHGHPRGPCSSKAPIVGERGAFRLRSSRGTTRTPITG
jgi:hypothetical protein